MWTFAPSSRKNQRGSVILLMLTLIGIGAAFLLVSALNKASQQLGIDKITADAMAQAKTALIGSAVMFSETHPAEVNGFMPLPDLGSTRNGTIEEGNSAGNFMGNATNLSVVGRLPWKALGLAPLRDSRGECLWYAVSGSFQGIQRNSLMNWDTLGQFDLYSSSGTSASTISTIGTNYHQRPAAVIFAASSPLNGQTRAVGADTVTECGGNYNTQNYLDTFAANPLINNIINYFTGTNNATGTYLFATPKSLVMGSVLDVSGGVMVNDKILAITPDDIFRSIKNRSDFGTFISNELLNIAKSNLSSLPPPVTLNFTNQTPTESSGGEIIGNLEVGRIPVPAATTPTPLIRWQDNLLYARCTSGTNCLTVNNVSCKGVVIFSGERIATQTRATNTQKNTWDNYLEDEALNTFKSGATTLTGASAYSSTTPSADVLACITTVGTVSFANDLGSFTSVGPAGSVTPDPVAKTVALATAAGSNGGCFWYPTALQLNGKTWRIYYEYTFTNTDPVGGPDRGNGFTFSLLRGDVGVPNACGTQANMGVLDVSTLWGTLSYFIETDIHQDAGNGDPAGNHTAIMANGNLTHTASNGTTTSTCNGTAQGCLFTPANKLEESPSPLTHNQRIEVHTGCNSTCSSCGSGGSYAKIQAWTDCVACTDTTTDFAGTATVSRCTQLDPALNTTYFGFTGGFRSGASAQGAMIQNLNLSAQ